MEKKDFTEKVLEIDLLLKTHVNSRTDITYVLLLHTETDNRETIHQSVLYNRKVSKLPVEFFPGVIRELGYIIDR